MKTRKRDIAVAGLFGLVVLAGFAALQPPAPDTREPLAVTVGELHRAFDANYIAAERDYSDRPLAVTVRVRGVQRELLGRAVVEYRTGLPLGGLATGLTDAQAAGLRAGDRVTLRCRDVTATLGTLMLQECAL